ncbi:hypothetical protein N431DRAFT_343662 [Stipitochalara longipes BDJ]|nr:hypothetical protein N431DRAFT_343662 [Stipitochalara longipes BDJ]
MEKTPESVAAEIQALKRSLSEVSTAIDEYAEIATRNVGNKDTKATGEVSESHKGLFLKTHALLATVRGPVDMLISNIENGARHACLRTVLEMGVFPAVPVDGSSITATALAEKLGVQKDLLVRLMRVVTANGPFAEVGKEEYAHTPYSKIYLVPGIANFFRATFDEFAPVNAKMHDYFRATGFKSPTSQRDNPYTYAHQTGGKDIWENLAQFPGRNKAMNDANSDNSEHQSWTIRLFPFESELQKIETTEDTVLLVDIGGGTGAVSKRIRGLTAGIKGKIVLQDRPVVLKGIEEIPGRELMEYDFFTPQPIQGRLLGFKNSHR